MESHDGSINAVCFAQAGKGGGGWAALEMGWVGWGGGAEETNREMSVFVSETTLSLSCDVGGGRGEKTNDEREVGR